MRQGSLSITKNQWLPTTPKFRPFLLDNLPINLKIYDLWWPNTKIWNEQMVRIIFIEEDADTVIELRVPQQVEDELI